MTTSETGTRIEELLGQLTLEEKVSLTVGRDLWTTQPIERLGIPSVWFADGPSGVRKATIATDIGLGDSIPATCFPTESALAASWDVQLVREVGEALGRECQAQDVQVLLGPGVNLKRSPLGGRNFEFYSEDPVLSGELAAALIDGIQSQGVGACVKHFVANEQETGRMYADSVVDERSLRELYLRAFEIALAKGNPWTVMAAYNRLNGVFCTESRFLLHDVLKQEWGYEGIVMSDWAAVDDRMARLQAGCHLDMPGGSGTDSIVAAVRDGRLDAARLDEIVRELLDVILRADAAHRPNTTFDQEVHHRLARRAAGESVVLLKNEGDLLPLGNVRAARVAVIGAFARAPRFQGGGSSQVVPTKIDNACDELARLAASTIEFTFAQGYGDEDTGDRPLLEEAQAVAQAAQIAVVFVGLAESSETEGVDRKHIDLPESHNALVEAVLSVQPNTVVVLTNGSAVAMPWAGRVPAIVEGWLASQAGGGAIADVLLGKVNPSGKLSETFPLRLADTPASQDFPGDPTLCLYGERLWTGYRWYDARDIEPLFPFGHGLSYTTFDYTDLEVDKPAFRDTNTVTVCLTVRNTGSRPGKEVVQLYARERQPRLHRPEKELKAFAKVSLQPGEEQRVELKLSGRDFAVYDPTAGAWMTTSGDFDLLVGASSRDIRLHTSVTLESTSVPVEKLDRLSPIAQWMSHPVGQTLLASRVAAFGEAMQPAGATANSPLMEAMTTELPVAKLVNFGALSEEDLAEMIEAVNEPH